MLSNDDPTRARDDGYLVPDSEQELGNGAVLTIRDGRSVVTFQDGRTWTYLQHVPMTPPPAGLILVHNRVAAYGAGTVPATRGFRAWFTQPGQGVPCDCDWAPLAGQHYYTPPA